LPHQNYQHKPSTIRQTVKISIAEGIFAQIYASLAAMGSIFITKFAVMLNAMPYHFGILAAIGQLSQVFQPIGVAITRKMSKRKDIAVELITTGRILTFLFGLLPFIISREIAIWVFLLIIFIGTSLQAIGGNIWIAWISDIVPLRMRGRFFSWRSQYLLIAGLITGYIAGMFIDSFSPKPGSVLEPVINYFSKFEIFDPRNLPYGFLIIFSLATVVGFVSGRILNLQPERVKKIENETLQEMFLTPLKDRNFQKLLLYGFWWMLAIGIGAPFWGPFMIKKLGMSLVEIQIYGTISALTSLFALRPWGVIIDRFGNKTAMRYALLLGGFNPMLWLFVKSHNYWLVYFEAATSGIMWSGAGIIGVNFVLSIAPDEKKQVYSGIFGALSGLSIMITMLISGLLLPPPMKILGLSLEPEQVLFGLTGLARWSTQIPLFWVEEKKAKPVAAVLHYLQEFASVRLTQFAEWIFRRR